MQFFFNFYIFGCAGSSSLGFFSSCGERGLLLVVVLGLLLLQRTDSRGQASVTAAIDHGLNSCGAWA